jgi:hypothetical protein
MMPSWKDEFALKWIMVPAFTVFTVWVFVASCMHAGNQTGVNDLGLNWLATNWMFVHINIALLAFPFLVCSGFKYEKSLPWIVGMMICFYATHQFEEHAYDIFGRRYSFLNELALVLGCTTYSLNLDSEYLEVTGCGQLTEQTILWINVYCLPLLALAAL